MERLMVTPSQSAVWGHTKDGQKIVLVVPDVKLPPRLRDNCVYRAQVSEGEHGISEPTELFVVPETHAISGQKVPRGVAFLLPSQSAPFEKTFYLEVGEELKSGDITNEFNI